MRSMKPTLEKAYEECHRIITMHSKTFSKAFDILPLKKRQGVWAVYAFCRTVDDIVDEGENPEQELKEFETMFHQFLRDPFYQPSLQWIALRDTFERFDMEVQPFLDMIQGQYMDLEKFFYYTLEEVEGYSYYVAGTVGLMLLPILSPERFEHLKPGAVALGKAMQLTNILRDVGEDLDRGRVYFPVEILEKHGYTKKELYQHRLDSSFVQAWEETAARAEELYAEALESIDQYPKDARYPVKGAAYMYQAILESVRKNNYQVFKERAYVSKRDKWSILKRISS
ncbi:squalene/phytoene synthase family protein [Marinococcus halophilus]|nr:squalene/phytoene synthase family protein [Marinococcus halophilus]